MKKNLQTKFSTRQYMLSQDFEIYYYNDRNLPPHVEMHAHNYYEFYFFLEGNVKIQIQEKQYPLQYGDLILIPPHVHHRAVVEDMDIPYRRFVFWISQEYCNHLLDISPDFVYLQQYVQIRNDYIFHNDRITFNSIQSRILRLIDEQRSDKFGRAPKITLCVDDLILHLNRLVYERNNPQNPHVAESLYQNVIQYIEDHLDENLSLDVLAGEFYVSKYHIAHVFKDNLGLSIHQYITKKRLSACREAIQGGENITQAYQMFGFGDYSSFYRAFKKEYGISPKDCQDMITLDTQKRPPAGY
ncbi:AraC family transcriptional regulator [Faecalicatena sp. AGMB00832]|uniref:AraC family transcriptional regulator n=1 Tax=Faecalicatena faecalis TaxID=2726362 RepID=A0ABS6CZ12_9FIRM|nr:AraC family transcriptional regulator [Faecalicatena faecalis]MBU3874514.1 AraC family transcriptional regulator [Faecalicatena faecalis]